MCKSFSEAAALLGGRESRKVANHTYVQRRGANIAVLLHSTDVVTYHADGTATLDATGYHTVTTKDRINTYSRARIHSERGVWLVAGAGALYVFEDGMRVDSDGRPVKGKLPEKAYAKREKLAKLVKAYIDGFCAKVAADKRFPDSAGDCFFCQLRVVSKDAETGESLGELQGDTDHLLNHLREKYYMSSLVANAVRVVGHKPAYLGLLAADASVGRTNDLRRVLRSYFRKALASC